MVATTAGSMSEAPAIVFTRIFDAPRELVFKMFADPKHLVQWWGPKGFTCPSCEVDLRVGGAFLLHMRGPDGVIYPCKGTYQEIIVPERIVYKGTADDSHPCGGGLPPRALVTFSFAEQERKTKLTIDTRLETHADREAAIKMGFEVGWTQTLERLADHLAHL